MDDIPPPWEKSGVDIDEFIAKYLRPDENLAKALDDALDTLINHIRTRVSYSISRTRQVCNIKKKQKQTNKTKTKHTQTNTNKQTNNPTNQPTKQTNKRTNKQTNKQASKQTNKQTNKNTDKYNHFTFRVATRPWNTLFNMPYLIDPNHACYITA